MDRIFEFGDCYIDLDSTDEEMQALEDQKFREAADKPGATFLSVFGKAIARDTDLEAGRTQGDCRERGAYQACYANEFAQALNKYAQHPVAQELKGAPHPQALGVVVRQSFNLLQAFRLETGANIGEGKITSNHERIRLEGDPGVKAMRKQARQLSDERTCQLSKQAFELLEKARNAEGNRREAQNELQIKVKRVGPSQRSR